MGKKSYLIIGVTISIFVIAIIAILLSGNNKSDWTTDIRDAQNFQIVMTDCNGREKKLNNNTLNELANNWNNLSNNGPWTGNIEKCYTTVTISYENNGIVKQKEIIIIDNSSLVLNINGNTTYYTNAENITNHLNNLFIA